MSRIQITIACVLFLNNIDYIVLIQSSMNDTFDTFEESISYMMKKNS